MSDDDIVMPGMLPVSNDVLQAILAAKEGDPSKFQSFWEMDEEGVDEESMEEIHKKIRLDVSSESSARQRIHLKHQALFSLKDKKDPRKKILWAAENNLIDTVQDLLQNQSDLISSRDADGYTPLHRACYNGHVHMVKYLIDLGANTEAQTNDGWRPLHSAARWNQTEVISLLLQCGANINAQTNGGQTALHLASTDKESRNTLEVLLMNDNIDTNIRNSMGETAYEICRRTSENCLLFEIREDSVNKLSET